jgi:hypothetical protein
LPGWAFASAIISAKVLTLVSPLITTASVLKNRLVIGWKSFSGS